ncbi:DUF2784 domain-containing protein [Candidatus Roizmanbacteria bacterium]|nr:DUF2784 domain-containing protein [Candidatus Roizmanbacteria bacterium]
MFLCLAAGSVLLRHLTFILFALLDGAKVAWRRWILFIHLPAAAWGFFAEFTGCVCPLSHFENYFRIKVGLSGCT